MIERSRLFGFGDDGTIVLQNDDCIVQDGGHGVSTRNSGAEILNAGGSLLCLNGGLMGPGDTLR